MTHSPPVTRTLLARLPKAELHCHLDGSVRPETLLELGREYKVAMPCDSAEALREYMVVRSARDLEEYLQRFDVTLSVMQTADALERIAYELAVDAAREGVRYLETRYAPVLNVRGGLSLGEAVEAPLRGLARAERETGITARVIVTALRTLPADASLELAKLAVAYRGRGVVGFDLAGAERGHPASQHAEAFRHAREHAMHCTCHAGEGDGARSVYEAVHVCKAQRIGHGTHLGEDPELTEFIAANAIAIEVCLTSNIQTHAAASYEMHPMRAYFDQGLRVVLNTDNRLMSGVTLVDEYEHAARQLHFTFDELTRVALNGFESAFLPEVERFALLEKVVEEVNALRGDSAASSGS